MKSIFVVSLAVISVTLCAPSTRHLKTIRSQTKISYVENAIRYSPPGKFSVKLLGTAAGPRMDLEQFGEAILIEAGDEKLLFDCGRGATLRMAQMGIPHGLINKVFFTHLHSDHVVQFPDLLLTGWVGGGRKVPLQVWGPQGTAAMIDHLLQAFEFDIHMRRDVDEKVPGEGIKTLAREIKEGVVFEDKGIKVTAFAVDHSPVSPAFGYRIDYAGNSVVLSGDTRVSPNLIKFAKNADVLIHETLDEETIRNAFPNNPDLVKSILAKHTTPEEAGKVFAEIRPRLAVYSHAPNAERVISQTRKTYQGPLQGAEDMLTIDVGKEIDVRHFPK